jgi:cytidine deaminase
VKALAVVVDVGGNGDPTPCGMCLQYVHGFAADGELEIVTGKVREDKVVAGSVRVRKLRELLPFPYKV